MFLSEFCTNAVIFPCALWTLISDTRFIYDGWNLIQELDLDVSDGITTTFQKFYVWGLDLSQSLQGAGGVGGLLAVVDSSSTVGCYCYDGNGNVVQYKYFDKETDLYYYDYRYYDAELARWINKDPENENNGFNLYAFAFNNGLPMKLNMTFFFNILWNLLLMIMGSILCAVAVNSILVPQKFFGAGFTGIAIVIHYLIPFMSVSIVYFILNIPVYAIGWIYVGRRFFFYSIPGMLIYSAALQWVWIPLYVNDRIMNAILAGIIMGAGSGIILRSLGSAGGTDILSVTLMKRFSIRLGTTVLGFNILILAAGAAIISLEGALFTLVYIYVTSKIVDLVVTGLSQRKAIFIISSKWNEISSEIVDKIHRGVTQLQGWGGYTGKEQRILYSVITFRELARLKPMINRIDPNAIVVVSDTLEVMGRRIGNQPRW